MNHKFRNTITFVLVIQILSVSLIAQTQFQRQSYSQQIYPRSGERYITDQFGVIRMWVNVWGNVNNPGSHLVYDGIDLVTLLSVAGGTKSGANLKKIRVFREKPDKNGNLTYLINMEKFLKTGDRSDFIEVLPNDTFVIPQTVTSFVISKAGIANTLMSIIYLFTYIQLNLQK